VRLLKQNIFAHKGIARNLTASTLHLRESRQISDFRFQISDFQLSSLGRFQIPEKSAMCGDQNSESKMVRFQISDLKA